MALSRSCMQRSLTAEFRDCGNRLFSMHQPLHPAIVGSFWSGGGKAPHGGCQSSLFQLTRISRISFRRAVAPLNSLLEHTLEVKAILCCLLVPMFSTSWVCVTPLRLLQGRMLDGGVSRLDMCKLKAKGRAYTACSTAMHSEDGRRVILASTLPATVRHTFCCHS